MPDRALAYFIRHGSTSLNDQGCFRGPANPPLDGHGETDAQSLKEFFKHSQFGEVISSDKLRTQQTARIVLSGRETDPLLTTGLHAWNVGYLSGLSKEKHEPEIQKFQENPDLVIPKGESLNQFRERVQPHIKFAIRRGAETGLPSAVFTHSSVIHEVSHLLHNDHTAALVKPGGAVAVFHTDKGLVARAIFRPEQSKGYGG